MEICARQPTAACSPTLLTVLVFFVTEKSFYLVRFTLKQHFHQRQIP